MLGDPAVGICGHGEVDWNAGKPLDLLVPPVVGFQRVDAQDEDLGVALVELGHETRHRHELRRAHRCEVTRVRQEHGPASALPLAERDGASSRLDDEVRCLVAEPDRHGERTSSHSFKEPYAREYAEVVEPDQPAGPCTFPFGPLEGDVRWRIATR